MHGFVVCVSKAATDVTEYKNSGLPAHRNPSEEALAIPFRVQISIKIPEESLTTDILLALSSKMLYPALRLAPRLQSRRIAVWHRCGVATATPKHPNPGNFANRSREEMSEIGHRGGKKGGKAKGVGGFHNMDPEKQV